MPSWPPEVNNFHFCHCLEMTPMYLLDIHAQRNRQKHEFKQPSLTKFCPKKEWEKERYDWGEMWWGRLLQKFFLHFEDFHLDFMELSLDLCKLVNCRIYVHLKYKHPEVLKGKFLRKDTYNKLHMSLSKVIKQKEKKEGREREGGREGRREGRREGGRKKSRHNLNDQHAWAPLDKSTRYTKTCDLVDNKSTEKVLLSSRLLLCPPLNCDILIFNVAVFRDRPLSDKNS